MGEHLAERFDEQAVRTPLDRGSVALVKAGDTYDAARLVDVPRFLRDGEGVVAATDM